jgi:hypothetical protein
MTENSWTVDAGLPVRWLDSPLPFQRLVDSRFLKCKYQEAVSTLNQAYIYYDLITDYFSRFVQSKNLLEVSCRWPNERIWEGSG